MTKISNQRAYIPDEEISGLDYLPGTDFDQALKTVNFRVQDLGTHYNQVNGVRNFDYNFYAHSGSNQKPADGYFYSNSNEQDPNNITYFVFSKKTARFKDTTNFFESISTENPFDLIIAQKVDINTIFFFRIDSIETFSGYYKLNVSEVFFPNGKELSYTLSYTVFNLKNEALGPIPTKTSDLTNDGSDGTSTYVETDELGVTAFSNDYNDLDNKPTIPTVITNHSGLSLDDGTNPHGTTKADVGLGNVDNTSDIDKPISTATQNALDLKLDKVSTAGVERAYIINADGSQGTKATSEFKDVLEFADFASFPVTGETGKIYLALDTNKTYRWSGSAYVELGGGANKEVFHWFGGNWTISTLDDYFYIGHNNVIGKANTTGLDATSIADAMCGRNKGLFVAPFDCKIKRVMFKEGGSGSYTGSFIVASGLPVYGSTWNFSYTNVVTHLNSAISATGYEQHKNEYLVTDEIVIPKGYVVSPMMIFSAQAGATKVGIEISIEIEEVV